MSDGKRRSKYKYNLKPPDFQRSDEVFADDDMLLWYRLHGKDPVGPYADLKTAYAAMEAAQAERDKTEPFNVWCDNLQAAYDAELIRRRYAGEANDPDIAATRRRRYQEMKKDERRYQAHKEKANARNKTQNKINYEKSKQDPEKYARRLEQLRRNAAARRAAKRAAAQQALTAKDTTLDEDTVFRYRDDGPSDTGYGVG